MYFSFTRVLESKAQYKGMAFFVQPNLYLYFPWLWEATGSTLIETETSGWNSSANTTFNLVYFLPTVARNT